MNSDQHADALFYLLALILPLSALLTRRVPLKRSLIMAGAWAGVGVDESSYWSSPAEGKTGGPGFVANTIAIRGQTPGRRQAHTSGATRDQDTSPFTHCASTSRSPAGCWPRRNDPALVV